MKGLLQDELVKNENADQPWLKSETDRMLDLYFEGTHPDRIAQILKRNPKAVKRRIEQFTYNERDRAISYRPVRRASRTGKRWTVNERIMRDIYVDCGFSMEALARVLQRSMSDVAPFNQKVAAERQAIKVNLPPGVGVDLVLAHYAVKDFFLKPLLIPEHELEAMKAEELEFGVGREKLLQPRGTTRHTIPRRITQLALYLMYRDQEAKEGKEIF